MSDAEMEEAGIIQVAINTKSASKKKEKNKNDKATTKKKKKNNDSDDVSRLDMTREQYEKQYSEGDDESPFSVQQDYQSDDSSMESECNRNKNKNTDKTAANDIVDRVKECLKILQPLQESMDFNIRSTYKPEKLEEMLKAMEELWLPIKPDISKKDRVNEMVTTIETVLGIEERDEPTPLQVETLMDKSLLEPIHNLNFRFANADLIRNDTFAKSRDYESRFQRLFMLQSYAGELYYNFTLWSHRIKNPELDLNESSIGLLRYLPRTEADTYPDFTKFLLYLLLTLQTRRYRRFKGCVYRPIYNSKGYYTNAWEKYQTIEEFVWGAVDLDRQSHIFKIQYAKGAYITEQAIKVLKHIRTCYFPELEPNRYLSSWRNGIYDHGEDKFYPYEDKNPYTLGIQRQEESQIENLEETVDELKKLAEKIPKYKSTFEAIALNLNQSKKIGSKEKEQQSVFVGSNYCSSIYIDQEFVEMKVASKNAKGEYIKGYWKKIQTHAFEKVLDSQEFDETENIGILSNNIERQWAMSSIVDKHIVIGYEVKSDFKWDQAEFQQCAACEELLVAQKHRDAFVTQFKSPIYLAANEMIKSWRDNSGSLKRRLVIIPFRKFIHPSKVDPNLMDKLTDEFSMWIQKINKAYREMTALYGKEDIWNHLSKALIEESDRTMQTVHELQHFFKDLIENNKVANEAGNESLYCTWKEFWDRFKLFCEDVGYNHSKIQIHDDYWGPVFVNQGLTVKSAAKMVPGSKLPKEGRYIFGLAFKNEDEKAADNFDVSDPQGKKNANESNSK